MDPLNVSNHQELNHALPDFAEIWYRLLIYKPSDERLAGPRGILLKWQCNTRSSYSDFRCT